jgi:FdhD protein
VSAHVIHGLPAALREAQATFDRTGGLHAAGLFSPDGALCAVHEDVGRHNAVDKLVGTLLLADLLPARDAVLVVSGRASFELVQKAAAAGFPVMVAVGAPSSLAVQIAQASDLTLVGFAREQRFNVYAGAQRLSGI